MRGGGGELNVNEKTLQMDLHGVRNAVKKPRISRNPEHGSMYKG